METFDTTFTSNESCDGVYYRLFKSYKGEFITIITLQYFDEFDYDKNRYVRDKEGVAYYFNDEEDAIKQLNEWYTPEQIDPEYIRSSDSLLVR